MIPEFDDRGLLPPGVHETSGWGELQTRFANNSRRQWLWGNLLAFVSDHLATAAQGLDLYVTGSFLSDKPQPDDIDCTVTVELDLLGGRPELIALAAIGNKGLLYQEQKIEFYLSLEKEGLNTGNFVSFFQYVGDKSAMAKG